MKLLKFGRKNIYYLLLGVLTLILLFSQVYLQETLIESRNDATVVNISGKQRMHSQMIAKLSLQLRYEEDPVRFEEYKKELAEAHDSWKQAHHYLKKHEDVLDHEPIQKLFIELDPLFEEIDIASERLLALRFSQSGDSIAMYANKVRDNEKSFLVLMDSITNLFEDLSVARISKMSIVEFSLLAITLLIIITEIILIFRPLIKQGDRTKADFLNLNKVINSLNNYAIFFMDLEGNVQTWSDSATNLKGYLSEEVEGSNHRTFYPTEVQIQKTPEQLLLDARNNQVAKYEGWVLKKDGSRFWASKTIMTINDAAGKIIGYGNITHDLTDFKKAEEVRVIEMKNKEMEQFTYIASHDLQEPLRTISNYVQVIEEDHAHELNQTIFSYLSSMKRATRRMSNLIKGLLDHSRLGKSSELEYIDTNDLMSELMVDLKGIVEENNAHLKIENLPKINGYQVELNQLFQNLVINAIKFKKPDEEPQIFVNCELIENSWRFSVSDNGIGIKQKYFDRIFKIFQRVQTSSKYEGYGIGLAHCKKIVQLHEGEIWVKSKEGVGSTFYFTLPSNLI
ncbi:ATP-binding protein [Ekhidna sp.]